MTLNSFLQTNKNVLFLDPQTAITYWNKSCWSLKCKNILLKRITPHVKMQFKQTVEVRR